VSKDDPLFENVRFVIILTNVKAETGNEVTFERAFKIEEEMSPWSSSRASPGIPGTRRVKTTPETGV